MNEPKKRRIDAFDSVVFKNVVSLNLEGRVKIDIDKDGKIVSNDAIEVCEDKDHVVTIRSPVTANSFVNSFGGIANVSGGNATVINCGRQRDICDNRVTFSTSTDDDTTVESKKGELHINTGQHTVVVINGYSLGSVGQLMCGKEEQQSGKSQVTQILRHTHFVDIASSRLQNIKMTGASSLSFHDSSLLKPGNSLKVLACGSSQLHMPKSNGNYLDNVNISTSGNAKLWLGGNLFQSAIFNASGLSRVQHATVLKNAQVFASGQAEIHFVARRACTVNQTKTGKAKVNVTIK